MTEHTGVDLGRVCLWGQTDTANSQSSEFKMRYVWTSASTVVLISVILESTGSCETTGLASVDVDLFFKLSVQNKLRVFQQFIHPGIFSHYLEKMLQFYKSTVLDCCYFCFYM